MMNAGSLDQAVRTLVRDVVRDVVRDELRSLLGQPGGLQSAESQTLPMYLSTKDAAATAGVSEKSIRAWVHQGKLRGHWAGRLLRLDRAELGRFLATGQGNRTEEPVDVDAVAGKLLRKVSR